MTETTRHVPSGAQWERTRLAWRRTVLTATVVALLGLRHALYVEPAWLRPLATATMMLLWLTVVVVAHRRITALTGGGQEAGRAPLLTGLVVVGFAAASLVLLG